MLYRSNKPYPKVEVEALNPAYAAILLEDYGGIASEDTAIHLYLYQSLVAEADVSEYKDIMLHISEVEMIHLRLLGEAITKLGYLPIYGAANLDKINRLWNAGYVDYSTDLKQMLEIDIEAEKQAIIKYEHQLTIIKDRYIRQLITRIIEDEYIHLSIFQNLYCKYFGNL